MSRLLKSGVLAVSATLFAVAGCASAPRATPDIAGAKALVAQAEQSDAQQFASGDLELARAKVRQAEDQERDHKEIPASRLAHEASVDAEVALAHTRAVKAEQALRDVNAGTQTLRSETLREGESDQRAPSTTTIVVVPESPTPVQR